MAQTSRALADDNASGNRVASTLKGRFIAIAIVFNLLVLFSAGLSYSFTQKTSDAALNNAGARQDLQLRLQRLNKEISRAEAVLLNYMIEPTRPRRKEVSDTLEHALASLPELGGSRLFEKNQQLQIYFHRLNTDLPELYTAALKLMSVRADIDLLYPASPLLMGQMLITHTEFSANSSVALEAAREKPGDPAQRSAAIALNDIRYAWTNRIGAFRLYVANRSGLFGEPESSMAGQRRNIQIYGEAIQREFLKLQNLYDRGQLRFEQEDAFERMKKAKTEWDEAYKKAIKIYESPNWRTDIPLLKIRIQPLLAKIRDDVTSLESTLTSIAETDLHGLGRTAFVITNYIWILGLFGAAVSLLAYYAFYRLVQRPLAQIVSVIESETRGETGIPLPRGRVAETHALINAFGEMRSRVNSRQQRLSSILDNAAEGIITFDEKGSIESINTAAESLFGYNEAEILGKSIELLIPMHSQSERKETIDSFIRNQNRSSLGSEGEVIGRHKNGSEFHMALKVSSMRIEGKQLFTGLVSDISERKAMLEHLKKIAEHDGLTGLFNRTYFQDELQRVIERSHREDTVRYAVLYIDLDNFKYVNDTMGHAAGDELIIEVASIFSQRARRGDLIARFGGDEFTLLLFDVDRKKAARIAESFRQQIADYHFRFGGKEVDIGCSIGIAPITHDINNPDEILSRADFACNMAKRMGRNRIHLFIDKDRANMADMSVDMGWSRRIKESIEKDRFLLAFQPIVDTRTRETAFYEVLLRLLDDNDEIIMPSGFLPVADRFGLAAEIDKWVIVNAIKSLARQQRIEPQVHYTINLSGQSLTDLSICELIQQTISDCGLDPNTLMFEVTETVAIADMSAAVDFLSRLRKIGCQTSLDDFGSGMSSFAYLKDLPVDVVKIDGRFVSNLSSNHVDQAMVRAMKDIAHALDKRVVAEFVENEESMQILTEYGIDYAQGFHLGRPETVLPAQGSNKKTG